MKRPFLVILAAGIGSRYGGLKQIDQIDGRGNMIVDYSIYDAMLSGFRRVVFIVRKEIEESLSAVIRSRKWYKKIEVEFVLQEPYMLSSGYEMPKNRAKLWGTAHAIACLPSEEKEPFAVINADDYYGRSALYEVYKFLENNEESRNYVAVGYKLSNTLSKNGAVSRGIMSVSGDFLTQITEISGIQELGGEIISEKGCLNPQSHVSMNLWGFTPDIIGECRCRFSRFLDEEFKGNPEKCEYYLPSVVSELIREGRARVRLITTNEKWQGITYKNDKSEVSLALDDMVSRGIYPLDL